MPEPNGDRVSRGSRQPVGQHLDGPAPRRRARVDQREVVAGDLDQPRRRRRPRGPRRRTPGSARAARWSRRCRARSGSARPSGSRSTGSASGVAAGHPVGHAADQAGHGAAAEPGARRPGQVEHARPAGPSRSTRTRGGPPGSRSAAARGGPGGEVAAGGVAERDDAARVDAVEPGDVVDGRGDVGEGGRPAAAVAEPAVLDVPGGPAAAGEVGAGRARRGRGRSCSARSRRGSPPRCRAASRRRAGRGRRTAGGRSP